MTEQAARSGDVRFRPATTDVVDDVVTVFGTRGDPAGCWCQWFRLRGDGWNRATTTDRRNALLAQLEQASAGSAPPPGVLAYRGDEVAGWAAVAPRASYPRVLSSQVLAAAARAGVVGDTGDPTVWAVTCFVVRTAHRRTGVAGELLAAAVDLARRHGAEVVEGYPVDVAARAKVSSAGLYHGTLTMFLEHGFVEVARGGTTRPVVRLQL